jgi:hypothetical protein
MAFYRTCPICGAALDPGERCDCQQKESLPGCANIRGGKAKVNHKPTFAIIVQNARGECQV